MALGLAARPLIHSTDVAPVAFATLVGPVVAPGPRPPKRERDLLTEVDVRECIETAVILVHGLLEERRQTPTAGYDSSEVVDTCRR
jgi:hypothetical protein